MKKYNNAGRARTCFAKYGFEHPMQDPDIRRKSQRRYTYCGLRFDSSYELAFYIWLTDSGIGIEYQPERDLWYEYDGISHRYHPDFDVGGILYELKGDQFLNDDGTWHNPYDRSQDGVYEVKRECCVRNGVRILYRRDYDQYVKYVERRYGRRHIGSFKTTSDAGK